MEKLRIRNVLKTIKSPAAGRTYSTEPCALHNSGQAPWHVEYFKLNEFEKWQLREGLSDLPLKQVIKPSCERGPPYTGRKGDSLSLQTEGHREESEQSGLFPPVYYA